MILWCYLVLKIKHIRHSEWNTENLSDCRRMKLASWRYAVGSSSWKLEGSHCKLEFGSWTWELEVGDWKLNYHQAYYKRIHMPPDRSHIPWYPSRNLLQHQLPVSTSSLEVRAGSLQLKVRSWKWEAGEAGNWKLEAGSWKLPIFLFRRRRLTTYIYTYIWNRYEHIYTPITLFLSLYIYTSKLARGSRNQQLRG